jgi:hypothetical protein
MWLWPMMPCVPPCADLYQSDKATCNPCVHCVMIWHQFVPSMWHQVGSTCQSSCGMVGPTVMKLTNCKLPRGIQSWGGFSVCCHLAPLLTAVHHSHTAKWQQCWYGQWCGPIRSCHMSLGGVTWLNDVLPRGMDWVRWTIDWLPRGTVVGLTCQVTRARVGPTCWHGPIGLWHVPHSLSSVILYSMCFLRPICTQSCCCPQVVPRVTLIKSQPLICLFNLFYLLWIYFNSSTYPKIMKFSSKISKFMMITPVIFNSIFSSVSLH